MKLTIWQRIVYTTANTGVYILACIFFRLKVTGRETFPKEGGVLIACNHVSYLDPPLVHSSVPRSMVHSMAKKRLFKHPFLNWFMTTVGTICVDPLKSRYTITKAVAALKEGNCVVIFPEGTRSSDGVLKKGEWGAISIALQSKCAIVPAAIIGSDKAFPKKGKGIKLISIEIRFGKPYVLSLPDTDNGRSMSRERLTQETVRLMGKIEALLPEEMRPQKECKKEWQGKNSI